MRWIVIGALALEIAAVTWLAAKAPDTGLPDPILTPGAVVNVDVETLCHVGYAASVRHYDCRLAVWREIPDLIISETYRFAVPLDLAVNVRLLCGFST